MDRPCSLQSHVRACKSFKIRMSGIVVGVVCLAIKFTDCTANFLIETDSGTVKEVNARHTNTCHGAVRGVADMPGRAPKWSWTRT